MGWPLPPARAAIGRVQAPQLVTRSGIAGRVGEPLRLPTPWAVPGDGPARAAVYGTVAGAHAIELFDIDAGTILWRDTTTCAGPVVGVTHEAIVCADGRGVRALGVDGKRRWNEDGVGFVTMTDERVVLAGGGAAIVVDADLGDELARVKLPGGVLSDSIVATCGDAGRELFAYGQDGRLVRIAEAQGGPKLAWAVPLDRVLDIDACEGTSVLVAVSTPSGTALITLARDSGKEIGRVSGVLGHWRARDGSARVEVSTVTGIARWSRELTGPSEALEALPLGELLAERGELRLARATAQTAVLLDRRGVRAYLPFAHPGAALGERALVGATWTMSRGETVHRVVYPERYPRALRFVRGPARPIGVPTELRDLPPLTAPPDAPIASSFESAANVALAGTRLALATVAPAQRMVGVATFDLAARTWATDNPVACGVGDPVGIAFAGDRLVCAVLDKRASVSALAGDKLAWHWTGDNIDRLSAAGELVLVHDAQRVVVLDGKTGDTLDTFASDTGAALPAAPLDVGGMLLVVTAERNHVVARLPRVAMAPLWSVAVHGVVVELRAAGDGVVAVLEDGDAYRIDARTGDVTALAGVGPAWQVAGDLILQIADGGPIPVPGWPAAPAAVAPGGKKRPGKTATVAPKPEEGPEGTPPRLVVPIPPPADLRPSWQATWFELTGPLRARNDYALEHPVTPATLRGPLAPVVVVSGRDPEVLVLDPASGAPLRRVRLPPDSMLVGSAFSTVVDGKPIVGVVLDNPVRVVLF